MNVLALNSSPRTGGQSKTEMMLNHLVQGMREAGAEVDPRGRSGQTPLAWAISLMESGCRMFGGGRNSGGNNGISGIAPGGLFSLVMP